MVKAIFGNIYKAALRIIKRMSDIISTDEDRGLRIETLHKCNYNDIVTMQTLKQLDTCVIVT